MTDQAALSRVVLPANSPALQRALHHGALPASELLGQAPGAGEVVPLRALRLTEGGEVELLVGAEPGRPSTARVWLESIRAISLTATGTPAIAALLAVAVAGQPISWPVSLLAVLGALLLQMSVNLDNDVEDYKRLIDLPGTPGGSGVLHKGWLSAAQCATAARALLVLGLLAGVPTLLRAPGPMAVVGLLALIGTAGYSGKPFGLKYRALGDLAVILLCGPVLTLGVGVAATGALQAPLVPLGLAFGLLAVGILHTNNLQDMEADRARGAATVAGLLGESGSKAYLVLLYVLGVAAWIYTALSLHMGLFLAVPALALVPTARLVGKVLRAPSLAAPELALLRIEAAQTHLAWGVLFIVALGTALAFG